MSDSKQTSSTWPLCGLLTIAFVILKLTHFIDWSWWWVTSPAWIYISINTVLAIIGATIEELRNQSTERQIERYREEYKKHHGRYPESKFIQKLNEVMEASKKNEKEN